MSDLLVASLVLAQRAGETIVQHHTSSTDNMRVKGQTDDGTDEPVTEADEASNAVLVNGYRSRFPQISIFSEEMKPPPSPPVCCRSMVY